MATRELEIPRVLPVENLSVSSINTYLRCPEKWRRRYIDREYEPSSAAMILGSAVGAAEGHAYQVQIDGEDRPTTEDVLDLYAAEFDERADREEIDWGDDKPGEIKDTGTLAVKAYEATVVPMIKPVSVEREFRLEFDGVNWGVKGFLDLEDENDEVDDLKVRKAKLGKPDADADIQPTMYLLARRAEGSPARGFNFHTMVKTKTPYAEVVPTTRTDRQLDTLVDRIYQVAAEIHWRLETDNWGGAVPGRGGAQNACAATGSRARWAVPDDLSFPSSTRPSYGREGNTMIEIKHIDGHVMYIAEGASDVRAAMEEAAKKEINLEGADFRGADLRSAYFGRAYFGSAYFDSANFDSANFDSANFGSANFGSANFGSANFDSANFDSANFGSANFDSAYFGSANFDSANFDSANFGSANFDSAYFGSANFGSANFGSAYFGSAYFGSANFDSAYFGSAYFGSANFGSANFGSANFGSANFGSAYFGSANFGSAYFGALSPDSPFYSIKLDLWAILDEAPAEVQGLRQALIEGQVDGSSYSGRCACLVGTIANVRKIDINELSIPQKSDRPAERWFIPIREGHQAVPLESLAKDGDEGVFRASVALLWVDQWVESRKQVAVALVAA